MCISKLMVVWPTLPLIMNQLAIILIVLVVLLKIAITKIYQLVELPS